jgi:hypothetical protein
VSRTTAFAAVLSATSLISCGSSLPVAPIHPHEPVSSPSSGQSLAVPESESPVRD